MTTVLEFTIKSRSGNDKWTSDMSASVPKSQKNIYIKYIQSISKLKKEV